MSLFPEVLPALFSHVLSDAGMKLSEVFQNSPLLVFNTTSCIQNTTNLEFWHLYLT